MNSSQTLIEIRGVKFHNGDRTILDIDHFAIEQGKFILLRGKNGAGKSTLLKVIAGLLVPDVGQVIIKGVEVPLRQAGRDLRRQTVYLHQSPYLFDRSVFENVAYGLRVGGTSRSEAQTSVTDALQWAGLSHLVDRNARELSGGEKQRVALTRARILKPQALLLDEPTANMDRSARDQTYQLIDKLRLEGIAVYIASHELENLSNCDQVIEIDKGRISSIDAGVQ